MVPAKANFIFSPLNRKSPAIIAPQVKGNEYFAPRTRVKKRHSIHVEMMQGTTYSKSSFPKLTAIPLSFLNNIKMLCRIPYISVWKRGRIPHLINGFPFYHTAVHIGNWQYNCGGTGKNLPAVPLQTVPASHKNHKPLCLYANRPSGLRLQ